MSTTLGTPERSINPPNVSTTTLPLPPQISGSRLLACVLCQQRKVKCDRKLPCSNCIKHRTASQCKSATPAKPRRKRRFPEQELLERLHKYEKLLRQNNIKFKPLSKNSQRDKALLKAKGSDDSDGGHPEIDDADWPSPSTTVKSDKVYETKNFWRASNRDFQDPENDSDFSSDDVSNLVFTKTWDELFENDDHLLFGSREKAIELSTIHPEPTQIFRLWQIYLENVDPLLKVTHTPVLQGRLVNALSNMTNISPDLEALMLSIYCTATLSLTTNDVQAMFGSSKEDLLLKYQFGCRQALVNCRVLRCENLDCLTALYLYLVSVRINTVPRALSSMLGVAIRIAERMGIHNESDLARSTPLEAETRRRLWWSLILFDTRIGEMADYKITKLNPTWNCKVPLNVNDSDLRPEMKELPGVLRKSSEALFVVVRSELGEFVRNTMFYLDFTAPALKPIAKDIQNGPIPEGGELVNLEKLIEDKYLKFCSSDNPLHFMTVWTARAFLAKHRLLEHLSKYSSSSLQQTDAQHDTVISYALNMLECDTKLMTSSLTKGFRWQIQFYFPFPAYIQIVQNLRRRPISHQAEQAWLVMNDNYESQFGFQHRDNSPFLKIFGKIILQSWKVREEAFQQLGKSLTPPKFVTCIRHVLARNGQNDNAEQLSNVMGVDDYPMSMPLAFGSHMYGLEGQAGYAEMSSGLYPQMPGQIPLEIDFAHLDWSTMNWNLTNEPTLNAGMNQLGSSDGLGFEQY